MEESPCKSLADELGLTLKVCHFPPGTSKWNKIEHRLFCFITKNWRGRPLTSYEVIVNLIANTTHEDGPHGSRRHGSPRIRNRHRSQR